MKDPIHNKQKITKKISLDRSKALVQTGDHKYAFNKKLIYTE